MQYSTALFQVVLIALSTVVGGSPIADQDASKKQNVKLSRADSEGTTVVSFQEMQHWLATTDAELTFVGTPLNALSVEAAQTITVTYCSSRSQNVCGGVCTVYTGGSACLAAPNTVCLSATGDVGFCDRGGCGGSCNEYAACGTRLNDGFCATPGTASIIVPPS